MRWAKTTKYQASVMVNLRAYSIVCEGEEGEDQEHGLGRPPRREEQLNDVRAAGIRHVAPAPTGPESGAR